MRTLVIEETTEHDWNIIVQWDFHLFYSISISDAVTFPEMVFEPLFQCTVFVTRPESLSDEFTVK